MKKLARSRVENRQRGRRVVFIIAVLVGVAIVVWQLDAKIGVISHFREIIGSATRTKNLAGLPRGIIYDRNLKQIAVTLDRVSVYARKQELGSITKTVQVLAEILSLDEKDLQQQLESSALRVWIAEGISLEQEIAIKSKRLSGVYLQKEEKRFYPNGTQAAHLIGYAENGIGLAGIEHYYDRDKASRTRQTTEQPRLNSPEDHVLTHDLKIQDILDKIVEEIVKQQKVRQVLVYAMEGRSGELVAGSQYPGFDPNNYAKYSQEELVDRFVVPILLPDKFRAFLRDVALLHGLENEESHRLPWSLRSGAGNLGSQLRLWEWLGFNEKPLADFHLSMQVGEKAESDHQAVLPPSPFLEMVPEHATPFTILSAIAALQNEGKTVRPFVVQKDAGDALNFDTAGSQRAGGEGAAAKSFFNFFDVKELFLSQARQGAAKASFFHDDVPVAKITGTTRHLLRNELLLVTLPAGGNDLNLLVVVEKEVEEPSPKNGKKATTLEQLVEEKVERISILQQVAKTVADVVEPEFTDDGNYQEEKEATQASRKRSEKKTDELPRLVVMPDLKGQSLRKSLRLLQGVPVKISIRGSGTVVSQKPAPGTSLKGVSECTLVLNKAEDIVPEKLLKSTTSRK